MNKPHFILIFLALILFNQCIASENNIIVTNARARLPSNHSSAIYFDVINNTENDLNIISASSELISNQVLLRNSYVDMEGIARTTNIQKILLPINTKISFKPQGIHIVLNNLKKNLNIGDRFEIIINFDNGAKKSIEVKIIN